MSNQIDAAKDAFLTVMGNLPVVGIPVQLLKDFLNEKRFRNIEDFMTELFRNIGRLEASQIDSNAKMDRVHESVALLERAIGHVEREPQPEKIHLFAVALAHLSTTDINQSYAEKVSFLDALDTLTPEDISTLDRFAAGQSRRVSEIVDGGTVPFGDAEVAARLGKLLPSLAKLESRGLLGEGNDRGGHAWAGPADSWINRNRRKSYEITPYGVKLLKILDKGNPPS